MGVWIIGTGSILIKPQVDETLIKEYIQFSKVVFRRSMGKSISQMHGSLMKIVSCFQ